MLISRPLFSSAVTSPNRGVSDVTAVQTGLYDGVFQSFEIEGNEPTSPSRRAAIKLINCLSGQFISATTKSPEKTKLKMTLAKLFRKGSPLTIPLCSNNPIQPSSVSTIVLSITESPGTVMADYSFNVISDCPIQHLDSNLPGFCISPPRNAGVDPVSEQGCHQMYPQDCGLSL